MWPRCGPKRGPPHSRLDRPVVGTTACLVIAVPHGGSPTRVVHLAVIPGIRGSRRGSPTRLTWRAPRVRETYSSRHDAVDQRRRGQHAARCAGGAVAPVVFGYPDAELGEQARRGEVILGGCVVEGPSPEGHCRECGVGLYGDEEGWHVADHHVAAFILTWNPDRWAWDPEDYANNIQILRVIGLARSLGDGAPGYASAASRSVTARTYCASAATADRRRRPVQLRDLRGSTLGRFRADHEVRRLALGQARRTRGSSPR